MESWIPAARAAASTSASAASGRPSRMFSRIVVSKRMLSWKTTPIWPASEATVASARSRPSKRTAPRVGSWKRKSRARSVLLPEPLWPTTATVRLAGMVSSTSFRTVSPPGNAKSTASKRMPAWSGGRGAAPGRSATSGCSSRSSWTRRRPEAARWNGSTTPEICWTADTMNQSSSKIAMTDPTVITPRMARKVAAPMASASRA